MLLLLLLVVVVVVVVVAVWLPRGLLGDCVDMGRTGSDGGGEASAATACSALLLRAPPLCWL